MSSDTQQRAAPCLLRWATECFASFLPSLLSALARQLLLLDQGCLKSKGKKTNSHRGFKALAQKQYLSPTLYLFINLKKTGLKFHLWPNLTFVLYKLESFEF